MLRALEMIREEKAVRLFFGLGPSIYQRAQAHKEFVNNTQKLLDESHRKIALVFLRATA
jgi:hypothetical protein